jgi:choline dehydrogenase-like flavoprotein
LHLVFDSKNYIIRPSTQAYGGTRIGDRRETNVVDRFGFSHEVPNLGIVGASVMGTGSAHNPTYTVLQGIGEYGFVPPSNRC